MSTQQTSAKETVPPQTSFSDEMAEWIEAFDEVVVAEGPSRAPNC